MYTPRVSQTIFVLAALLCTTLLEARDKTDIVSLKNGDRVTGEIEELQRGKLTVKTDSMGTVSIEWREFGVRLGDHFYMTEGGPRWFSQPYHSVHDPLGHEV